tara:strand:- start:195 stop:1502 length:1308 start_codon:yes stop_codon:yes gene_type:complete
MSYRNPKAAPINTGAAVYQGIQKLAGDVYTFATEERVRKGQLIGESIAAQQAIDDDINKMGLTLEEGENNFENQIFAEAQAAKQKIAAQYDIMSKTFSSPEQRAKAKAEINKLNKYPEGLTADLATGKYLVDQFRKGLSIAPGKTGSISATNDLNTLEVVKDMQSGGKNTKIETNEAGARTLVTNVDGKTYKLNVSNITNGLKTNPNQIIFNTVSDDSSITNTYLSQMGLSGKNLDIPALVKDGILKKESRLVPVAGKSNEIYTVDRQKAYAAVAGLSQDLVRTPSNYTYTNSIWQDKLGNSITLKQALASEGEEKVLEQIREYYVEEAIGASIANGISVQLPKPEKGSYYKTDIQLRALAKNPEGKTISANGKNYKIEKGFIIPQKLDLDLDTPGFVDDKNNKFPLYNVDKKGNKTLNYSDFRALTGDTIRIKN